MRRFYSVDPLETGCLVLPKEVSRHIRTVLRLGVGTEIELFNGRGRVARARIIGCDGRVQVEIMRAETVIRPLRGAIHVGQGAIQGRQMDLVVQKYTELGVSSLTPVLFHRCQPVDRRLPQKRYERWHQIIRSSGEQCGSNFLMDLHPPRSVSDFLDHNQSGLKILFWEEEQTARLRDLPPVQPDKTVRVLIGPKGGITREEVELARGCGFHVLSLGRLILRAETAGIAAVTLLQQRLGNMG